ncbi:MAG: hypothetical protein V2I31_14095 [Mariniphaga sp.]|jgi:hypothetical protein|nr:hypothetical protein [Mariniphaga sp.]
MKKLTVVFALVLASVFSFAQDDYRSNEIQTLFSNQESLGFYGGFSFGYSQIDGKDALISGARAALIFNHSTAIGLAGYGFVNDLDNYGWMGETEIRYSLAGAYGGIFIEPILGGLKPVHIAFPVLFGVGGAGLVEHYAPGFWDHSYYDSNEGDFFFIVEPAVELEFNLARFFRTAATLSYRYTSDIDLLEMDENVLNGLHFGLTFKFGKF